MMRVSAMPIVRTHTTRTPLGPRSTARDLVSDSSAPKAAPMAEVFAVPPDVPRDGVRAQEEDDARSSTDQVPGRRPGSNELRRDDGADRQHELLNGQVHGAGRVVVLTD